MTRSRFTPRLSRRRQSVLVLIILLALGAFVGSALTPGGSTGQPPPFAKHELAGVGKPNPLAGRLSKVYGSNKPASRYGTEIADLEDSGTNLAGERISDLSPLPPRVFSAPENEYRRYARHWITTALFATSRLRHATVDGNRAAAKTAWASAWSDYLHLGAVYLSGEAAELNQAIDGNPGVLPGGGADPHFTGFHRLELGLWTGAGLHALVGYDERLARELHRLYRVVAHVEITPLEYATRSHEIIEDAQRDLLSGLEVPLSAQGVLGTAAGLAATREVFHTLEPLLSGRENTEGEVRTELLMLNGLLDSIRRHHGGRYPSLSELGQYEHEQLNGYVAGALSALEQMPGTLETEVRRPIPRLPAGR